MIHEEHSQSGSAMEDTQRMIDIIDCRFQTNYFQKVWYASEEDFRSDFGEPPVGLQFPIKVCDIDFYENTNTFQAIRGFTCHIYIIKEYNEHICSELRKLLSSSTNYRSLDINVFAVNGQIDEKSMLNALAHETLHSAKNIVLYTLRHPGDTNKDNDTKYADVQDQHANDLSKTMYGHAAMASNSKSPATKTISNLIYYFSNDEVSARISQAFVVSDTNELWSEFQENVNIFNNLNTKYTDEQILEACKEIGAPRRIIYSYIRNGIKMFRRKFTTTLDRKINNRYKMRRPIRLPESKRVYKIINEIVNKYITNNTTRAAN